MKDRFLSRRIFFVHFEDDKPFKFGRYVGESPLPTYWIPTLDELERIRNIADGLIELRKEETHDK